MLEKSGDSYKTTDTGVDALHQLEATNKEIEERETAIDAAEYAIDAQIDERRDRERGC